jgi:hypothetical protein
MISPILRLLFIFFCCGLPLQLWASKPDTIILGASLPSGKYGGGQKLELSTNCATCVIYFTSDGSEPTQGSRRYSAPIRIDSNSVIVAQAYKNDGQKSAPLGLSYIFKEATAYPVVSIIINPNELFGPASGLFMRGNRGGTFPNNGANYKSNRQVAAHIDFFENDGSHAFGGACLFKIFGGVSRMFPQKSIALEADEARGTKRFKHKIFPDRDIKSFKHIVLRNSGSDFGGTHIRDGFITSLGYDMGLEVQAFRPAVVYINGQYWGIYNIREKINKHYFVGNFGIDKDSVDLMLHNSERVVGKKQHYEAMQNYMRNNDMSLQKHADYINTQMDVSNFIDYEIMQIFIDNQDAGGNIKYWRAARAGSRWRWVLYDTDFGFGHYGVGYKANALAFHTATNGPNWPNPPWSTFNLRVLLRNDGYRDAFITRFLDRMNTILSPAHTLPRLESMADYLRPELRRHLTHWDLDEKRWTNEIKAMREFAIQRPAYMRQHLRQMFPHVGRDVRLKVEIIGAAKVVLNQVVNIEKAGFDGIYFAALPVEMEAKNGVDWQFSHWEVQGKRVEGKKLKINFGKDTLTLVRAIFKEGRHPQAQAVVINEIAAADSAAGDWIELYNPSSDSVFIGGWQLKDKKGNSFILPNIGLPSQGYLPSRGYIVLAQNVKDFKAAYPQCPTAVIVGNYKFGFDRRRDEVWVYDAQGQPVDSVSYDLAKGEKGSNIFLALRDPLAPTNENWLQENASSPAIANPVQIVAAHQQTIKNIVFYTLGTGAALGILAISVLGYARLRQRYERIE